MAHFSALPVQNASKAISALPQGTAAAMVHSLNRSFAKQLMDKLEATGNSNHCS